MEKYGLLFLNYPYYFFFLPGALKISCIKSKSKIMSISKMGLGGVLDKNYPYFSVKYIFCDLSSKCFNKMVLKRGHNIYFR